MDRSLHRPMSKATARVHELRALETLSAGQTAIHRLHPLAKILSTFTFIVIVASFGRYDFFRLIPYLFYPFIMMALAELPYRLLLSRTLIALPFCLFAGISNIIFDKTAAFAISGLVISLGVLSFATVLLKMYLCVMSALLLAATTPFPELTVQMRRLRVPMIFIIVFETTFRYIGVLLEEIHTTATAYRLRSGTKKALEMRHMGSFVGQLMLRGFDRAERVHAAMRCRGYSLNHLPPARREFQASDMLATAIICLPTILLRFLVIF